MCGASSGSTVGAGIECGGDPLLGGAQPGAQQGFGGNREDSEPGEEKGGPDDQPEGKPAAK